MQGNGDCGGRWHQMGGDRWDFMWLRPSCHRPRTGSKLVHPWGEERITEDEADGGDKEGEADGALWGRVATPCGQARLWPSLALSSVSPWWRLMICRRESFALC